MRILIVPLPVLAPTQGSQGRVRKLIEGFKSAGFEVATCAALDDNFKKDKDVFNYFLDVPIPMGLPNKLGRNLFQVATKLGVTQRKAVHSFEEILFLTGALSASYFEKNIACVRAAIQAYEPDVVYSEFNLGTIVAAHLEHVKVITNYSYPVQPGFACSPHLSQGVNKVLRALGMPEIYSALELFDLADYKVVPSSKALEPIQEENVVFTGPFLKEMKGYRSEGKRHKILAYMGAGTISAKRLERELRKAFYKSDYEVYIVGKGLEKQVDQNIHTAEYFNFQELLPTAAVMIHHGGQNSVMDGLRFAVPQLIYPGKVFERKYNAQSVQQVGAGLACSEKTFDANQIRVNVEELVGQAMYSEKSQIVWEEIAALGGMNRVIALIKQL